MTESQKIIATTQKLFDDAWEHSSIKPIGREFALSRINAIRKYDPIDFIVQISKTFERRDNISLLLSICELWTDFSVEDWLCIMQKISPRKALVYGASDGMYTDIEFLVKYLQVDVLKLSSLDGSTVSHEDKVMIEKFCYAESDRLNITEEDLADLDGVLLCSQEELKKTHDKLIKNCPDIVPT